MNFKINVGAYPSPQSKFVFIGMSVAHRLKPPTPLFELQCETVMMRWYELYLLVIIRPL